MVNDQLQHRVPPAVIQAPRRMAQVNAQLAQYVLGYPYAPAPVPVHVQPLQPVQAVQPPPHGIYMGAAPQQPHQYVRSCRCTAFVPVAYPPLHPNLHYHCRPLPNPHHIPPNPHYHCYPRPNPYC
jgi:hypothetical protein